MKNLNLLIKILSLTLNFLTPWICLIVEGPKYSLSSYWHSDIWWLFVISNLASCYFFIQIKGWQISSIFLIGLTAFPTTTKIFDLHDFLAILFFLSCGLSIYKDKRLYWYIAPYLFSMIFLTLNLFWAEVIAITTLCIYHLHAISILLNLKIRRYI